ncbi:MAG: arginine--tRNA ligase [Chloroflexi bacterium]|nr:MAG: arginine--tRNA ligase [Chloroflexota bacterium]
MLKEQIAKLIEQALRNAQAAGDLPAFEPPERIPVERARPEFGDYASPVAMTLARSARMAPIKIAEAIARHIDQVDFLGQVEVAPPGFINLRLSPAWLARQVSTILAAGDRFGNIDLGRGRRIQVEFVSSNPNGPLTIGHGRNAAIGDTMANVLEAAGYQVQREYYFNDAGRQMTLFYASVYARYMQELGHTEVELPDEGYRGAYVIDLAREIIAEEGDRFAHLDYDQAVAEIGKIALQKMIDLIKQDMALMGVRFDRWYTESSVYETGLFDQVLEMLREKGYVEEKEGAIWFTSTELGEDKDNVIVRSNGHPTYFASDIAYHYDKFILRGFDEVIDVWGADHQGHVPRMKAVMRAFGLDPDRLDVIIYQLVTLKRGDEIVRLSTRSGDLITLREVIEEVGGDVVRFLLLQRSPDAQMDFDLELAKDTSEKNPVYYVQYAHARIASILRYAQEQGVPVSDNPDLSLLTHPAELNLIREMLRLPEVIELVTTQREPHHLTHYAQDLATAFHAFYKDCRVISSEPGDEAITQARLALVRAAKLVLARTLRLLGVDAPERM